MLSGLQPPHHTPEPQTALAASPCRQTGSAGLIPHPNPSALTFPGARQDGGTEGAARAGQLPQSYRIQDIAGNPCPELHRPLRCLCGPILVEAHPGRVTGQQAQGHPEWHLPIPATTLRARASCHPTFTPAIHHTSSVSGQLLVLNLMPVKYFGFKLFLSLPGLGGASPSRQNNLGVSGTDSP